MPNERLTPHALLAVFPDRARADEVAAQLARQGVEPDRIRIDAPRDERTSLSAEVLEESTEAYISPQVGVAMPKETLKAGVAFGVPLTIVGAVLGAIVGAVIPFDWPIWARALTGAVCGAAGLGTIAFLVVPAMSVKNPHDPSPAETGSTLWLAAPTEELEKLLVEAEPLRLDRLGAGDTPQRTVVTEDTFSDGGIVQDVAESFAREHRASPEDKTR